MRISTNTSTKLGKPRAYVSLGSEPAAERTSRGQLAVIRGIIWSLQGMIYAPLFTGLMEVLQMLGFGPYSYALAAATTGAVGAVLFGAREISLISSGLGAAVGVVTLILLTGQGAFFQAVTIAAVLAATVGLTINFSSRCSRNVASKALAGLSAGLLGGTVLAVVATFQILTFPLFAVLAFLVAVNAVFYVLSLRGWVALTHRACQATFPCYLVESAVMAILAGVAAGSVWMISGPLTDLGAGLWWQTASLAMHQQIPQAILGGLVGGGIAGALLELFRVSWVNDL